MSLCFLYYNVVSETHSVQHFPWVGKVSWLENNFNLICRWHIMLMASHRFNVHMTALFTNSLRFQFEFCTQFMHVLLNSAQILYQIFKQSCLQAITLLNYDVISKIKWKVHLRNLPISLFRVMEKRKRDTLINVQSINPHKIRLFKMSGHAQWPTIGLH